MLVFSVVNSTSGNAVEVSLPFTEGHHKGAEQDGNRQLSKRATL
jgi:hypothetical protein